MSYSNFGYISNEESLRGKPGYGYAVDEFGNYDIQNNNFVNVDDIELASISSPSEIIFTAPVDLQDNKLTVQDLQIDAVAVDNTATVLALNGSNEVVTRTVFPSPFDQDLNTTDDVAFNSVSVPAIDNSGGTIIIGDDMSFSANDITAVNNATINNVIVNSLASSGTSVSVDNDLTLNNNNISGVNTVSAEVLDCPSLSATSGTIKINDDVVAGASLKLTSVAGEDSITSPGCLHLQSDTDACIYVQADRDGTAVDDNPLMLATTNGGNYGFAQLISNLVGATQLASGTTANNTSGRFQFFTTQITNNGDAPPLFDNSLVLFDVSDVENKSLRDFNMDSNNITNGGTITTAILDCPSLTATSGTIAMTDNLSMGGNDISGVNVLTFQNSIGSNGKFDSLNVDTISGDSGVAMTIAGDSTSVAFSNNTLVGIQKELQLTETAAPTNPAGLSTKLYRRLGSIKVKDSTGLESDLINNFNQELNTTDSPTFTGLNLADDLDLNTNNIIDVNSIGCQTITSPEFNLSSGNIQRAAYSISARAILANTDTALTTWTTVQTSARVNVNASTGVFAPVAGLYALTYSATITTAAATTQIGARLVDDLGANVYSSVVITTDLFEPDNGETGAQYENLVGWFDGVRTYTIHCKVDANETMDFNIVITRIM